METPALSHPSKSSECYCLFTAFLTVFRHLIADNSRYKILKQDRPLPEQAQLRWIFPVSKHSVSKASNSPHFHLNSSQNA